MTSFVTAHNLENKRRRRVIARRQAPARVCASWHVTFCAITFRKRRRTLARVAVAAAAGRGHAQSIAGLQSVGGLCVRHRAAVDADLASCATLAASHTIAWRPYALGVEAELERFAAEHLEFEFLPQAAAMGAPATGPGPQAFCVYAIGCIVLDHLDRHVGYIRRPAQYVGAVQARIGAEPAIEKIAIGVGAPLLVDA